MSASRISTGQIFSNAQSHVASAREKEIVSSEKASTMKEIVRPSQNPSGWVQAASLKDDLSIREAIAKNTSLATNVLNTTEMVLSQMQECVQKAQEIAVGSAGTDDRGAATRKHSQTELQGIFDAAVQTLNTRYGNRTLFAGLKSQGAAFDREGNYLGDSNSFEIEIARGLTVPLNISAERYIQGKGTADGVDILTLFKDLQQGLRMDDPLLVQNTLESFSKANDQISLARSDLAARMNQLDRALEDTANATIDSKDAISKIEDADAIKVFSELARDQTVLRASLQTSQKLLTENPSDILYK